MTQNDTNPKDTAKKNTTNKGKWDTISKLIIQHNPQAFIDLFLEGAIVVTAKPPALEDADLEMDNLILVKLVNKKLALVNIEVQTNNQLVMPDRLLEYNVETRKKYKHRFPVLSGVIYLLRKGKKPTPPHVLKVGSFESIRFEYLKYEVGQWLAPILLASGILELLPFLPLTEGGLERECLEAALDQLQQLDDKFLASLTYGMASLAFPAYKQQVPDWLVRKRDAMVEENDGLLVIPWFREMFQQKREEGREEGLEEGLKRELASLREMLLTQIQNRFPTLTVHAKTQVIRMKTPEIIKAVAAEVSKANSAEEAEQALLSWQASLPSKKRKVG